MQKVEIRVKGYINKQWSEWFGDLAIDHSNPNETVLHGKVQDQAALYGIISHLRDLGLQLISVNSEEIEEGSQDAANQPRFGERDDSLRTRVIELI